MKCKICGRKTSWDESYGHEKFIVCPRCYKKLNPNDSWEILSAICRIGLLMDEEKKS